MPEKNTKFTIGKQNPASRIVSGFITKHAPTLIEGATALVERTVVCNIACTGISTEALNAGIVAELVKSLEDRIEELTAFISTLEDSSQLRSGLEKSREEAKALLAKATGEAS